MHVGERATTRIRDPGRTKLYGRSNKKWGSETDRIVSDVKAGMFGKGQRLNYTNTVREALVAFPRTTHVPQPPHGCRVLQDTTGFKMNQLGG